MSMHAPRLSNSQASDGFRLGKLGGVLLLLLFCLAVSTPSASPQIRVALLGDLMLGRGVAESSAIDPAEPLARLADDLQAADLALANLESPLTARPLENPDGYDLRASPEAAAGLAASGLDLLSLANNHSLDSGPAGLNDTREALAQAGLLGIAAGDPAVRLQVSGVRLAVLAYEGVTRPLDLAAIEAAVRREKAAGQVVIVSLHWGGEYRPAAEPSQVKAAQALAQAGADLIWGHHPHVLQPVAWLPRPGFDTQALVAYSLGNALFDQPAPPDASWGAMLWVTLDSEGVQAVEARPFEINLRKAGLQAPDPETESRIFERLQLQLEK